MSKSKKNGAGKLAQVETDMKADEIEETGRRLAERLGDLTKRKELAKAERSRIKEQIQDIQTDIDTYAERIRTGKKKVPAQRTLDEAKMR